MKKIENKEPKIVFISVDEALKKGQYVVNYPSWAIMVIATIFVLFHTI